MVLKTETCRFSGLKIYPGKGIKLARTDGQVLLFLNSKCKRLYNNKLKASKLAWTALYRKAHKKDQSTEAARRKKRSTKVTISRSIGSASLELIQKRRNEKSDVRAAARENALREIKERAKRLKEEKAKTKTASAAAKPKQAAPKAGGQPKGGKGGPGGKR